jgi:predicted glycosyltransferase
MVILSGPEPQRGMLEIVLSEKLLEFEGKIIFVKGKVEAKQKKEQIQHITYYNFMTTRELEQAFNESRVILCRSGYTTVMDIAKLEKKAFFIPTPGQYEQEYLAKRLKKLGLVPFAKQEDFQIEDLEEVEDYKGLQMHHQMVHWKNLFCLFESKREF